MGDLVKFTKLKSITDSGFWAKFAELKLEKFKLQDEIKIPLWASYNRDYSGEGRASPLSLDCTSFNENLEITSHNGAVVSRGFMMNTSTYEAFRAKDPETFINLASKQIVDSIKTGSALDEPCRLAFFVILCFGDLKRYRYHYWLAHPACYNLPELRHVRNPSPIQSQFTSDLVEQLRRDFRDLNSKQKAFFTVIVSEKCPLKVATLKVGVNLLKEDVTEGWQLQPLEFSEEIYFAFYDPCLSPEPGWPLRNLLCLLFWHCPSFCFTNEIKIIAFRGNDAKESLIFSLKTKDYKDVKSVRESIFDGRFVGWEKNHSGKMGPNILDLSDSLDIVKLSERAVDFNLKLMKWRLVPELNLDKINKMRCLLLGAGTLGCAVARVLIGWAVSKLTLVDSSIVSQSNPVRQSLYTHADAVHRRYKAEAAKEALLQIHPSLNVESVILQVPMPGHVVGASMLESTKSAISTLDKLISEHDVVFLLLDSREARWLPTVLCAAYGKLAITAALGFDSYTVQRHGTRGASSANSPDLTVRNPCGQDLGCYFCNDITQPGNSQVDRTLDQQCTVSRPGLAQIAGGLAVELMVSLTQHPQYADARALMVSQRTERRSDEESGEFGLLGGVPHTIRGSLWSHETHLTVTHRFPACTACSVPIVDEYRQRSVEFVLDACNQPSYLEHVAGIDDLLKRPDLDELCYAIDSSSDDEDEGAKHT